MPRKQVLIVQNLATDFTSHSGGLFVDLFDVEAQRILCSKRTAAYLTERISSFLIINLFLFLLNLLFLDNLNRERTLFRLFLLRFY